jgi:hypothetical protein
MFKANSKLTLYIIIAVVVIGLLVFIYFIGRRSGKVKIEQVELPQDQPGGQLLTSTDSAKIRQVAQGLYNDLKGVSWGFHDAKPYNDLLQMSDTLFVAVYNDFNNLYGSEGKGTLRDWIKDDYAWIGSNSLPLSKAILDRMDKLGLR